MLERWYLFASHYNNVIWAYRRSKIKHDDWGHLRFSAKILQSDENAYWNGDSGGKWIHVNNICCFMTAIMQQCILSARNLASFYLFCVKIYADILVRRLDSPKKTNRHEKHVKSKTETCNWIWLNFLCGYRYPWHCTKFGDDQFRTTGVTIGQFLHLQHPRITGHHEYVVGRQNYR